MPPPLLLHQGRPYCCRCAPAKIGHAGNEHRESEISRAMLADCDFFSTMRFNNGPAAAFRALLTRAPINTRIDRHQHRVCKFETQHLAQKRLCVCPRLKSLSAGVGNLQAPIGVFSYPEFKIYSEAAPKFTQKTAFVR
jgi:hypothetical protein